tara:strand:- start:1306 stop:3000 length:1695 start_codon:yes stop_codon:yes gene_type:complete
VTQASNNDLITAFKFAAQLPLSTTSGQTKKIDDEVRFLLHKAPTLMVGESSKENPIFIEVPVLRQNLAGWPAGELVNGLQWKDIKGGQDRDNCGYHALKNTILLMNAFASGEARYIHYLGDSTIHKDIGKQIFFACMGIWAPIIYNYRIGYDYAQFEQDGVCNINGKELDLLHSNLSDFVANLFSVSAHFPSLQQAVQDLRQLNTFQDSILITEDVRDVGVAAQLPVNESMLLAIRNFAQKQSGMLGVVWTAGRGGHWVSFVVHKTSGNNIKIYYMNSIQGYFNNFNQVRDLFTMTVSDIDQKIYQNQQQQMREDIVRMKQRLDVLQNKLIPGKIFYSEYVGCIQRNNTPMKDFFTKEQLLEAGFADDEYIDHYLDDVNNNWQQHLKQEYNKAQLLGTGNYYQANIAAKKDVKYGFWINTTAKNAFVITLTVNTCIQALQKYKDTDSGLLVEDKGEVLIIRPQEAIHTVFNQILVSWKDFSVWSDSVKQELSNVIGRVLDYLQAHPNVFHAIDWTKFGDSVNNEHIPEGFTKVMEIVFKKIGSVSNFDIKRAKTKVANLINSKF